MKNRINIGTEEESYWMPELTEEEKKAWHESRKQTQQDKFNVLSQKLEVVYAQDNDCTELSDLGQFLTILTADGGGGDFFIIETERWAINDIEEFIEILKDFKSKYDRLNGIQ